MASHFFHIFSAITLSMLIPWEKVAFGILLLTGFGVTLAEASGASHKANPRDQAHSFNSIVLVSLIAAKDGDFDLVLSNSN
jgi:hypothetical protein